MARKSSLLVLALTAVACSRLLFLMIDDPEGPNLLVVLGMAAIIYLASLAAWFSKLLPSVMGLKRVSAVIFIQMLLATGFYILLC